MYYKILLALLSGFITLHISAQQNNTVIHSAPAPLYRDPVYDGAADPVLIWNRQEKSWWMLYTARRANAPAYDVSAYFGTSIGVASSSDHGQTWTFRGYLNLEFEKGMNTFWAPDIVFHNGVYHMFVVYIKGVRNHWGEMPILYILQARICGTGRTINRFIFHRTKLLTLPFFRSLMAFSEYGIKMNRVALLP